MTQPAPGPPAPWPPTGGPRHAPAPWPGPDWQRAHDQAIVFGILAVTTGMLGLVFGPLALNQANRARAIGPDVGVARVLAWIGIGLAALSLLFLLGYFLFFGVMMAEMLRQLSQLSSGGTFAALGAV